MGEALVQMWMGLTLMVRGYRPETMYSQRVDFRGKDILGPAHGQGAPASLGHKSRLSLQDGFLLLLSTPIPLPPPLSTGVAGKVASLTVGDLLWTPMLPSWTSPTYLNVPSPGPPLLSGEYA